MSAWDAVAAVGSLVLFIGLLFFAVVRVQASADPKASFEESYTTVNGRITECSFWLIRHLCLCTTQTGPRLAKAGYAMLALIFTMFVPVAALALSGIPDLSEQGVAVGAGALVWSCLLESGSLPDRTRINATPVIAIDVWLFAVVLVIADLLLVLFQVTNLFGTSGSLWAAAVGASFVALADLASVAVGLAFAAASHHPLADP